MGAVIVDSSVWTGHLRRPSAALAAMLRERRVLVHPLVFAELMLGRVSDRTALGNALRALPAAPSVHTDAVVDLMDSEDLYEQGIGFVDAHLLASARVRPGVTLWSQDKRLIRVAKRLGVAAG